jgi:hypothetical protein
VEYFDFLLFALVADACPKIWIRNYSEYEWVPALTNPEVGKYGIF